MSSKCIRLVKRYLCVKRLTIHDGFTVKSVKLPRAEARFFMGELRNRQAIPVVLLDEDGRSWELLCTCTGAQYALSRIGAFCEAHGARPGYFFIFYADNEHIVRLAVRPELPEDVQAALAAARAAAALRCSPQAASPQQSQSSGQSQRQIQQQIHATSQSQAQPNLQQNLSTESEVVLGPHDAPPPMLDDPAVLEEMPVASAPPDGSKPQPSMVSSASTVPAVAPGRPVAAEPPRALPLQDRSNMPATSQTVLAESSAKSGGKSRPLGAKNSAETVSASSMPATVQPCSRIDSSNKENDTAAQERSQAQSTAQSPRPGPTSSSATSTGGLSPPSPTAAATGCGRTVYAASSPAQNTQLLQPQQQGPKTPPPAPASPQAAQPRSPSPQAAPSPATRLRLRFEARLRMQAGKPHPLSVRTGPDDPTPAATGYGHAFGLMWPASMAGRHAAPGTGILPAPWGSSAAWQGHISSSSWAGHGGVFRARHGASCSSPSATIGSCGEPSSCRGDTGGPALGPSAGYTATQQPHSQAVCKATSEVGSVAESRQLPLSSCNGDSWRQQLQCDELLDWEVGRRAAAATADPVVAQDRPGLAALLPSPPQPPPPSPTCGCASPDSGVAASSSTTPMNLSFLRQLLLRQHGGSGGPGVQAAPAPGAAPGNDTLGGPCQVQQQHQHPGPRSHLAPWSGPRAQGGVLLSLATANSTLRQLLGGQAPGGTVAAAWELAARATGLSWRGAGQASRNTSSAGGTPAGSTGSAPLSSGGMCSDCPEAWVFTARAKSGLAAGRSVARAPAEEWPCPPSKRPRPELYGQTQAQTAGSLAPAACVRGSPLGFKALTTLDLLSDRVTASMETQQLARALANLLPYQGHKASPQPAVQPKVDGAGTTVGEPADTNQPGSRPTGSTTVPRTPSGYTDSRTEMIECGEVGTGLEPMDETPNDAMDASEYSAACGVDIMSTAVTASLQRSTDAARSVLCTGGGDCPANAVSQLGSGCVGLGQHAVPVEVVVESGAEYEGVMLLGASDQGKPCGGEGDSRAVRSCEVQGLRPYLIRRQAGVGDVLWLWVDTSRPSERSLRLRALLQQPHALP